MTNSDDARNKLSIINCLLYKFYAAKELKFMNIFSVSLRKS